VVKRKVLAIIISVSLMLAFIPLKAGAGPYMGGYLKRGVVTSNNVLLSVNYQTTQPGQIPSGKWLAGVASVAGASGSTPTGWTYQNAVFLYHSDDVKWGPQAWYGNSWQWYYNLYVGSIDYIAFYERMDIHSGRVYYRVYVYRDFRAWDADEPVLYTWDHPSGGSSNFLVGSRSYSGVYYKHFQFGVESNYAITETDWEVLTDQPSYYDGTDWRYTEGRVCWHDSSAITWIGTQPCRIGNANYSGVNTKYTSNDRVCWEYTGQTIGDDHRLWSGSGIASHAVDSPYITPWFYDADQSCYIEKNEALDAVMDYFDGWIPKDLALQVIALYMDQTRNPNCPT